jgi:hypothetical protein
MAARLDVLLPLLFQATREPLRRKDLVAQFQNLVWSGLDPSLPSIIADVMRDLAYDLDYFEPNPYMRSESASFYGHARFEEEVRSALQNLHEAGIDVRENK